MTIKRILAATDGSAPAQAAIAWAAEVAAPLGAEVVLLSVVDFANGFPGILYMSGDQARMRERLANDLNEAWSASLREARVSYRALVREGRPAAVIVETAAAEEADLIAMGSRGQAGVAELVLGSVARNVLHHARTPVVIMPPSAVTAMGRIQPSSVAVGGASCDAQAT
jgi:nucleotide-binding universal stress UspA family protein